MQPRSMSSEPSYTEPGAVHDTASAPVFKTVTVTLAEAEMLFSADTVTVYVYSLSSSTLRGTANVGVGPSVPPISRAVCGVGGRAFHSYVYSAPAGAPDGSQSSSMSSEPS